MRFEGIAFPRALIEAQERGELAIFAGAGVSMPAPSSLPDFNSLANELANGTETRQDGEAADRFLGKLSPNLNIHERTQRRLGSPDSRPNSMHHDLLKLFSASSAVRLVTTNFDDHFASAATEVFVGESPEMFFAPALPVGSDFVGIVHLHGSVRQDPRRIVLTDRDFGRAYLTEGWARRFVLELFLKYTVLFVGYSHNDPVMQYLARGLPPGDLSKRRYAFGVNNSKASWDNLGIQLQVYSERNEINRHVQLQIACSKWAQRVRETPLESREQIRQIVEKPPQPAGDEIDLIEKAIEDRVLLQFFTEFASTSEWLNWTSGREAFRRILNSNSPSTNGDRQLALWFAQKFAIQHAGVALDLIRRNGSFVPPLLWESIAWVVWQSSKEENDSVALNAWLPVLVTNQPPYGHNFLEYILAACRLPKDDTAALLLIRHLLKPSFTLREGFVRKAVQETDEPAVGMELTIRGNPTFVDQGWQHFKEAGIGPYADRFLSVVVFHLEEATELFRLYGTEFTGWDPISVNLSTLDSPSITLSHNGLSLLVDIARETLKWIIENEPDRGIEVIRSWATAQSLTLRRLAAHGVALTSHWSADDKLSWLKDRLGLFEPGLSPETRRILDAAFADASQSSRDAIVKAVAEGPKHRAGQERQRDGTVLALLVKLDLLKPNDPLTLSAIQEIKDRRPEFAPPELSEDGRPIAFLPSWERLPFGVASLLATPATESIDILLSFEKKEEHGPDRTDVQRVVRETAQENPAWGYQLTELLCARRDSNSDLWPALIAGLSGASAPAYARIIRILSEQPNVIVAAAEETISLLERGTSQEAGGIESPDLPRALEIGLQAWRVIDTRKWLRSEAEEWLTVAINDPAGTLLQTVVRSLVQLKKQDGEAWTGLPIGWRDFLSGLVEGRSWSDAMGRIILAAQVQLLFELDRDWTNSVLLSIFGWSVDQLRAQQAWHGYLVWGTWSDEFLEHFLPRYVEAFAHLDNVGKFRSEFCQHLAAIAVFSNVDPVESGWLKKFVIATKQEDRYSWASSVSRMLKQVPTDQRENLWGRWIRRYWSDRIQGIPSLLSGLEITGMAEWPLQLQEVFAQAVQLLLKSPAPVTKDEYHYAFVLMQLQESSAGNRQPTALAHFILYLLQAASRLDAPDSVRALVLRLIPTDAERTVLVAICERLAVLGFSVDAAELKQRILA